MLMSQHRRHEDSSNDEDDSTERRTMTTHRESLDGLELVPTILKIKQLVFLRHTDFLALLTDFNETLEVFTKDEPHFLRFTVVPHSDSGLFWKALVRIRCTRVSRTDQSVANEIILNLHQFLSVHQSLVQQISTLQKCPSNASSQLYNSSTKQNTSSFASAKLSFTVPDANECCICMDRQSNLVLPCTHKFCDECFHQWSSQSSMIASQTCPLCRVDTTSDCGFLLAEKPKYDSVKKMLTESILSLPEDYKTGGETMSITRNARE